jgi:hypothetical protein
MGLTRARAYQIFDIDFKQAVRVVTLENVVLSGGAPLVVDGVTLALHDRVLVTGQTVPSQNGLYYVTTLGTGTNGTWQRSSDGNETGEIDAGMIVMVTEGDSYDDTQWKLITDNPIDIDVTPLTFVNMSASANQVVGAVDDFTGDGSTVSFPLSVTPTSENLTFVNINGSEQFKTSYSLTNNILTFNTAPEVGATIEVTTIYGTAVSVSGISSGTTSVNIPSISGNIELISAGNTTAIVTSDALVINGLATATGNVSGNYILGNGAFLTGINTGNISKISNGTSNVSIDVLNGNVTIGASGQSNVLVITPTGTYTTGIDSVTGNIIGGNLLTGGLISATGTITGGNLATGGTASATGTITGGNIATGGTVSATGAITGANITGANLLTGGLISATGTITGANITGSNFLTNGLISATGTIVGGNLQTGGTISASGNVTAGNVSASTFTGNLIATTVSSSSSITGGNLFTGGEISATGRIQGANVITTGNVTAGNVLTDNYLYANGTSVITALQTQIDAKTTLVGVADVTKDMQGIVDRTQSTLSFNDATRTFTITPASTSWQYYFHGAPYTVSTSKSIVLANTSGGRFIRIDPNTQELVEGTSVPDFVNHVILSYIYYDATLGKGVIIGDERHGSQRDTTWHSAQHQNVGTVWRSGGSLSYTLNDPATITITVGSPIVIADEDLVHNITNSSTPNGYYQQVLTPSANLEVLYLNGTSYSTTTASTTPWIAGTSLARYNLITGGSGSLVDATEGSYFTYWVLFTTDIRSPVKLVLGRNLYSTVDAAYGESFEEYGLSFAEQVFAYQIVVQTSASYANTPKIVLSGVRKITSKASTTTQSTSATSHNALTGRDVADTHPIGSITNLQTTLDGKQATLVSNVNIKTVNSTSLLGSGDVSVGTVTSVVGTGTVNGITLSGTVTSTGNLTLGGTLSNVNLTTQVTGTLPVSNGGTGNTSITGIVKGTGTTPFTNAVAGTDYAPPTSGTSILYGNGAGGFSNVTVGSGLSFTAGTLAATNPNITVGTTPPVSPSIGDLWVDTN